MYVVFLLRLGFLAHNASFKKQNQPSQVTLESSLSITCDLMHLQVDFLKAVFQL